MPVVTPLPPELDDGLVDDMAVDMAIRGDKVRLGQAERDELVRRMLARGRSVKDVSQILGTSYNTAQRLATLVTDDRVRRLPAVVGRSLCGGRESCRGLAAWVVTYPDGSTQDYCTTHALAALKQLGPIQIPQPRHRSTGRAVVGTGR